MKKPRPSKKPRSGRKLSAWAVALDAAQSYATDFLDPNGDAEWGRREDYLEDVVKAVRAHTTRTMSKNPADRLNDELVIGTEAGYLFGLALGSAVRQPVLSFFAKGGGR